MNARDYCRHPKKTLESRLQAHAVRFLALPFPYHFVDPDRQLEKAYTLALQANDSSYNKCIEPLEKQYSILEAKLGDLKKALDKEIDSLDDYVAVDISLDDLDKELSKETEELKSLHKRGVKHMLN